MKTYYKLLNTKTGEYVQDLKSNFTNKCGVASCGYHFEDVIFKTEALARSNAKMRKSYKDLVVVEFKVED
jgi:hypothetical protein